MNHSIRIITLCQTGLIRIEGRRVHTDQRRENRTPGFMRLGCSLHFDPNGDLRATRKRCLTRQSLAFRSTARQERSAAHPSVEGVAALLWVLAGCLEGTLRNYSRQEPSCAAHPVTFGAGRRANTFELRLCVHRSIVRLLDVSLGFAFLYILTVCRALAKRSCHKVCIFLVLRTAAKRIRASTRDSVPPRNTPAIASVAG